MQAIITGYREYQKDGVDKVIVHFVNLRDGSAGTVYAKKDEVDNVIPLKERSLTQEELKELMDKYNTTEIEYGPSGIATIIG